MTDNAHVSLPTQLSNTVDDFKGRAEEKWAKGFDRAAQSLKCAQGEHEAGDGGYIEARFSVGRIEVFVCKHCGCVFAEKQ